MNAFLVAAVALLAGFVPCGVVIVRAHIMDAVVALELAGGLATLAFLCLAAGFDRASYFSVALVCAVLTWISGLVYARFLGRWL